MRNLNITMIIILSISLLTIFCLSTGCLTSQQLSESNISVDKSNPIILPSPTTLSVTQQVNIDCNHLLALLPSAPAGWIKEEPVCTVKNESKGTTYQASVDYRNAQSPVRKVFVGITIIITPEGFLWPPCHPRDEKFTNGGFDIQQPGSFMGYTSCERDQYHPDITVHPDYPCYLLSHDYSYSVFMDNTWIAVRGCSKEDRELFVKTVDYKAMERLT